MAIVFTFLFIIHAIFYIHTIPRGLFPDEKSHLSYIRDIIEGDRLVPDYAGGTIGSTNTPYYINHPPLYYSAMAVLGSLNGLVQDDAFRQFKRFRALSLFFFVAGIVIWFVIASRVIESLFGFAVFCGLLVGTPIFPYIAGAVNNDTFVFLGSSLFFLGALLLLKDERQSPGGYGSLLLALGILISFLSKATGAAAIFFAFSLVAALLYIRHGMRYFTYREFVIPIVFAGSLVALYYGWSYYEYGTLFPAAGRDAWWEKVKAKGSESMGLYDYAAHFFTSLLRTFGGVTSHRSIYRLDSPMSLAYPAIMATAIAASVIWSLRQKLFLHNPCAALVLAGAVAGLAVLVIHFVKAYGFNLEYGYRGGIQARYYAAVIPILLIGLVRAVDALGNRFVRNAARTLLFAGAVESYLYFMVIAIP